jgi:hypothetical protein
MKKQAVCEYCNMIFEEAEHGDYKQECVKHEITHLNLNEKFESELITALKMLDLKYGSISNIINTSVSTCWDSYYGKDVTYEFEIHNDKMNKIIKSKIEVNYENKESVPTSDNIYEALELHYFIPTINHKYEGKFTFEDYMGGHGCDDYMVGDVYMNTIFNAFKNKKVRIEIID